MNRTLLGAAVLAAGVAALIYAMLSYGRVECEACVRFDGRETCKRAAGADRDAAARTAIATACAVVAHGVTGTLGCQGREPVSLTCQER